MHTALGVGSGGFLFIRSQHPIDCNVHNSVYKFWKESAGNSFYLSFKTSSLKLKANPTSATGRYPVIPGKAIMVRIISFVLKLADD